MERSKRNAVLAAIVICVIVFAVGAALVLSSGAPEQSHDWVPTIVPTWMIGRAS